MSLIEIWNKNPEQLAGYAIRQIVAIAGDGKLRDVSDCSAELREFLKKVNSEALASFTKECLTDTFDDSGFVLQDIANEIGRRLEFDVENGLYRGKANAVGFDGIWKASNSPALIVEVKTTDLYNVRLENVADYRRKLIDQKKVGSDAAVLFIVGRQDTGSLEAQIRGSRHAWTMRVVGAESLVRLMKIKEKSSSSEVVNRIQALLQPVEYTRIDGIADLMFEATEEVETSEDADAFEEAVVTGSKKQSQTDKAVLEQVRAEAVFRLGQRVGEALVKRRRASFATPDDSVRAVVSISKRYESNAEPYWYAYHTSQDEFLGKSKEAFFVLGCVDTGEAYALPLQFLRDMLPMMNQTVLNDRQYWHVKARPADLGLQLVLKAGGLQSIEQFKLAA